MDGEMPVGGYFVFNRRNFMAKEVPVAALSFAAAFSGSGRSEADAPATAPASYFEFLFLRLENGSQVNRMLTWIEKRALPLLAKHHFGFTGFFTLEVGPHMPTVFGILTFPSLAEMESAWARLDADADYSAAVTDLEKDGAAFYREDSMLMRATPFSPPLKAANPDDAAHKIYELRIYESPAERQLQFLHERFAGGEIDLFHKSGIHPVLYADTIIGPNQPNMAYLIPFENQAQREKAWATFRSDPAWQRLRDDSIRRGGEIVRNSTNMILLPTSFSLLR